MIHNTQGTQNEKALHLFLEHFSCFQLANGKDKNKQKTQQTNTMHKKKTKKQTHSKINTYSMTVLVMAQSLSDLLQPQTNNIAQRCIYDL